MLRSGSFRSVLEDMLEKEFNDRIQQLAEGGASHFVDYRERVGYIKALREVLSWCDMIEQKINGV